MNALPKLISVNAVNENPNNPENPAERTPESRDELLGRYRRVSVGGALQLARMAYFGFTLTATN
jgi:hypothetical protein